MNRNLQREYILEFNTSTINFYVIVVGKNVNYIELSSSFNYPGITLSSFNNSEETRNIVCSIIDMYNEKYNIKINDVNILLPQCFFRSNQVKSELSINEKVTQNDIDKILSNCNSGIENCTHLETIPIAYLVKNKDEEEKYVDNPLYFEGYRMEVLAVNFGILNKIKEIFDDLTRNFNVSFNFYSSLLLCVEEVNKKLYRKSIEGVISPNIYINFNEDSVDICYFEMNAPIIHKNILNFGINNIIDRFAQELNINDDIALKLLKRVNLHVKDDKNYYIVKYKDKNYTFNINEINKILIKIINRIFEEQFSSEITSIVGNSELKIFIFMPIFYKIKGLNEKIQKAIKYDIQLINLDFLHNSKEWIYPLKQFLTK